MKLPFHQLATFLASFLLYLLHLISCYTRSFHIFSGWICRIYYPLSQLIGALRILYYRDILLHMYNTAVYKREMDVLFQVL